MSLICFDLEGPLSPQDNAYELMKLFPQGGKVFEVISRYDDLLTIEERQDYEPGDTLALIAPFLAGHEIKEANIAALAQRASLTPGAAMLIPRLSASGWRIFCISTSYEQYALHITQRLGIPPQNVACTFFPLNRLVKALCKEDFALVEQAEREILDMRPVVDDDKIKQTLDYFFWHELPKTNLGALARQIKPVGGQRKVEALERFAEAQKEPLSNWVVVGDSITDFKMLQTVDQARGLAVAFNANEYALPYATIGLASVDLNDLWEILETWERGKRLAVEEMVKQKEKTGGTGDREHFHWLSGVKNLAVPLEIHKRIRHLVRQEAAKLG